MESPDEEESLKEFVIFTNDELREAIENTEINERDDTVVLP